MLRVATYNIRKAVGLDWRRDPERILDVVNRLGADIVALQEADQRFGDRPAALPHDTIARETDFVLVDFATNDVSLGWHGNALLVRKSHAVVSARRLDLPGLEPRGAVHARVETSEGAVDVVGTHLGLVRHWRRKQLKAIRAQLRDSPDPSTIIMGDFNEWSPRRGLEPLQGVFSVIAPGKTFHAARPMAALDRIAHGGALEFVDAGVDESPAAQTGSDHLPVWADFRARTSRR